MQAKFIMILNKLFYLTSSKAWMFFILILIIGLFLRFYRIEEVVSFGWDQGRDAFVVRDILQGNYTLIGPRTGIGHFHLGPVYYYLLAPFYYITNLDPMASNYFNIVANIINFTILFVVSKKLFNNNAALLITLIYATNQYLMGSRIPWNVTLMPSVSALIFYSIVNVYENKYVWTFVAWTLSGFFFNLHFAVAVNNIYWTVLFIQNAFTIFLTVFKISDKFFTISIIHCSVSVGFFRFEISFVHGKSVIIFSKSVFAIAGKALRAAANSEKQC